MKFTCAYHLKGKADQSFHFSFCLQLKKSTSADIILTHFYKEGILFSFKSFTYGSFFFPQIAGPLLSGTHVDVDSMGDFSPKSLWSSFVS